MSKAAVAIAEKGACRCGVRQAPTPERNHRVSPVAYAGERGRAQSTRSRRLKPRVPVPMRLLSPRSHGADKRGGLQCSPSADACS